MFGPPPDMRNERPKIPGPKSVKEIPGYIYKIVSGTIYRLLYIFRLVWQTKPWILFLMVFMAVFNGLMPIAGAYISANLLNALADGIRLSSMQPLYPALLLQFVYLILNSVTTNIYNSLYRIAGELVTNNIKLKIMNKAKEVDTASFDKPDFYEKLENANREAGMRPIQILSSTFSVISTVISMISFIAITAAIIPYAPAVIIAVSVPSAIINFIYRRKTFNYMRRRSVDRRQMNYYSDLTINKDLAKEVRLFGLSDIFINGFKKVFDKYFKGIKHLIYGEGTWNTGLLLLSTAVNCLLYIQIGMNVINGSGQIGDFSLYTSALNSISTGVSTLIATSATIYEGTLFTDNLIAFMKEKKTLKPLNPTAPEHVKRGSHTIRFDRVCFRYPGADTDVLHDISFTLQAGEVCVLVGLNGAGKTTLIKLLTRLYDPTSGTIYLDGKDIRAYDLKELYSIFGIIFQDFGKYAFSVSDNIAFGRADKPKDENAVHVAAQRSSADKFIEKLPQKYETPLMRYFSEDGTELSIGQWQKLSIARAFYADSDIIILDEPTASLDALAEQEIFRQFDQLRKGKTTVFVSHRLSSATVATKIIVLESGRIAEEGNHKQLMQAKGKYYELFSAQAERYIAEEGSITN